VYIGKGTVNRHFTIDKHTRMSLLDILDIQGTAGPSKRAREWSLGLFFLCCVVVLWVLSSFLLNDLFERGTYSKPFFITWFNTASFVFYLIPYYFDQWRSRKGKGLHYGIDPSTLTSTVIDIDEDSEVPATINHSLLNDTNNNIIGPYHVHNNDSELLLQEATDFDKVHPLTFKETMKLSFSFCILWFSSNFFNNASLIFTSVSSQTILSSTSSFFTMLVGYMFGQESFDNTQIISLIGLFIGVICVTFNDNPQASDSSPFEVILGGDLLALLGALCYGIYSILLKYKVKDDSRMDMKLFFGFVGVFNTFLLWPSLVIVHYTGIEKFELPPSGTVWSILLFNCFISFLADFLWARAMLLTSPLTVTVGLCLTIPLALICDIAIKFKLNSPVYFFGAFLVCFSFYWINKNEHEESTSTA
jgi:solute carrier family 35, member F5